MLKIILRALARRTSSLILRAKREVTSRTMIVQAVSSHKVYIERNRDVRTIKHK